MNKNLEALAIDLIAGKRALFITGAGLSVASGISPYRISKNAIWNKYLLSWGTRKKFLESPLVWWNKFWLRTHQTQEFLNAKPNAGHLAISKIVQRCNAKILTQNIDKLHLVTLTSPERLIEVHGRLGLYKCIIPDCPYSWSQSIKNIDLDSLAVEGTSLEKDNLLLKEAPTCPSCGNFILPQALLFDEMYESHSFYRWEDANEWFKSSEIYIFVGTSFSVGVTFEAFAAAKKNKKKVYNFNVFEDDTTGYVLHDVIGKSEETLPQLYNSMLLLSGKPTIYFYPDPNQESLKYLAPSPIFWPTV